MKLYNLPPPVQRPKTPHGFLAPQDTPQDFLAPKPGLFSLPRRGDLGRDLPRSRP